MKNKKSLLFKDLNNLIDFYSARVCVVLYISLLTIAQTLKAI